MRKVIVSVVAIGVSVLVSGSALAQTPTGPSPTLTLIKAKGNKYTLYAVTQLVTTCYSSQGLSKGEPKGLPVVALQIPYTLKIKHATDQACGQIVMSVCSSVKGIKQLKKSGVSVFTTVNGTAQDNPVSVAFAAAQPVGTAPPAPCK